MNKFAIVGIIAGCVSAVSVLTSYGAVAEETDRQCKLRLMQSTKLAAVAGEAVTNFAPDTDPSTLEIVFLSKPDQGKNRVSDDGQVIYLNNPTDEEQQALIGQAFDIRMKLGFCSKAASP
jgi:hypothetical protein